MERSRRTLAKGRAATMSPARAEGVRASTPPASSKLTVRPRKNRRRPGSLWSRVPRPRALADACGRALRRSLPALVATCAIMGAGTAIWLGYRFLTTSERYAITAIDVRGTERLTPDEIRAALPVSLGDNVFTTSTDEAAAVLRRNPWIAAVTVQRILPDTLVVELREHVPVAIAVLGDPYLVGADGHPFVRYSVAAAPAPTDPAAPTTEASLPIVTGLDRGAYRKDPRATAETITAALATLARWRDRPERPAIGEVHVGAQSTLTLRTYDHGTAIELGLLGAPAHMLAARLAAFDAAWAELSEAERGRARAFHLDARPDHVTVAFAKD